MAKKLGDTRLYPFVVALITKGCAAISAKNPEAGTLFKARFDGYLAHYGNVMNLPIPSNENEEAHDWYNQMLENIADHLTAKDFNTRLDLRIAVSNLIICYTETIKKPKVWEELLYTDLSESIDGFEDFELIRDSDSNLVEVEEEEEDNDADVTDPDVEDPEEDSDDEDNTEEP